MSTPAAPLDPVVYQPALRRMEIGRTRLLIELTRLVHGRDFPAAHKTIEALRGLALAEDILRAPAASFSEA